MVEKNPFGLLGKFLAALVSPLLQEPICNSAPFREVQLDFHNKIPISVVP